MQATLPAYFMITADHPCLAGHFPGRPVVPGVVVLDHVLQALQRQRGGEACTLRLPQVKFMQPLLPGQRAEIHFEKKPSGAWAFRVQHGEAVIAAGEILPA